MSTFFNFGFSVGAQLRTKQSAKGVGGMAEAAGDMIGGWLGRGAKAAPPVPARAAGGMTPPPLPAAPPRGQGAMAPKVTISPAEAAAGRATVKLTPQEMSQMSAMNEAGRGFSLSPRQAQTPVAARAAQQNGQQALLQGGGTAEDLQRAMGGSFREHAARQGIADSMQRGTYPTPSVPAAPGKVTVSPAEAAAGRAAIKISPEEAAGAAASVPPPARLSPRDNQSGRGFTLLNSAGLRSY